MKAHYLHSAVLILLKVLILISMNQDKKVIGSFAQNVMFIIDVHIQDVNILPTKEQLLMYAYMKENIRTKMIIIELIAIIAII